MSSDVPNWAREDEESNNLYNDAVGKGAPPDGLLFKSSAVKFLDSKASGVSLFQYSCQITNGRTRKCFRASLFTLAEEFIAFTRSNDDSDGIICEGKNIALSLVFKNEDQLYKFQSALLNRVSVVTGSKRPALDILPTVIGHDVFVTGQSVTNITFASTLTRMMRYASEKQVNIGAVEDSDSDDSDDDNIEVTGNMNGDSASIFSCECVKISDAETRVQMIENHYHAHFVGKNPEVAHIKDKANCSTNEINDVNNHLFLSCFLHEHFDGINMVLNDTPSFKVHYVDHDPDRVDCPVDEGSQWQVTHVKRHRCTIRISFFSEQMRTVLLPYSKDGYESVETDIVLVVYFPDGNIAKKYFDWKEKKTLKKWKSIYLLSTVLHSASQLLQSLHCVSTIAIACHCFVFCYPHLPILPLTTNYPLLAALAQLGYAHY